MRQGDRMTSLISAGPPCPADRRKLFIPKLKWDTASYYSHLIQKTNDIQSLWPRLNKETRLRAHTGCQISKAKNLEFIQGNILDLTQVSPGLKKSLSLQKGRVNISDFAMSQLMFR